jgi:CSLREA domain-containing protein
MHNGGSFEMTLRFRRSGLYYVVLAAAVVLAALGYAPVARADTTIIVTTTEDELIDNGNCSLREAILAANTGAPVDACPAGTGAVTIEVPAGTYQLAIPGRGEDGNQTGDLDIWNDVTITGAGSEATIIDGGGLDRVLHVLSGAMVVLNDLGITGGVEAAAAVQLLGLPPLRGGGGIANQLGDLTLNNVAVFNNSSDVAGGGILNTGNLVVNSSVVDSNSGLNGGGIATGGVSAATATATINNSIISFNAAARTTGLATGTGGGIWNGDPAPPATAFTSVLNIVDSTIMGNTATNGGGVASSSTQVAGYTLILNINRSTISGNSTLGSTPGAPQTGNAGGVLSAHGTSIISNSTISGNLAGGTHSLLGGLGGGIFNVALNLPSALSLVNTTLAENSGLAGGGVGNLGLGVPAAVTVQNTIVARNTADPARGPGCQNSGGAITSLGNNLEDGVSCPFTQPGDLQNVDPLLGPLQDNGGPTATHALLPGSPAIDAGNDLACQAPPVSGVDQRLVPRPQGTSCDIGAFEFAAPTAVTLGQLDVSSGPGGLTLALLAVAGLSAGTLWLRSRRRP